VVSLSALSATRPSRKKKRSRPSGPFHLLPGLLESHGAWSDDVPAIAGAVESERGRQPESQARSHHCPCLDRRRASLASLTLGQSSPRGSQARRNKTKSDFRPVPLSPRNGKAGRQGLACLAWRPQSFPARARLPGPGSLVRRPVETRVRVLGGNFTKGPC